MELEFNAEYGRVLSMPTSPSSRPHPINPTDSDDQPKPTPEDLSAAVSRLPVELLAEVFLDVAESSLEDGNTRFAAGTFSFLQVCKHWNEVAVNTPRLWRWWVADAAEAWPLFNSRSEGIPLLLTWRCEVPESARDILMDPTVSKRIQQLDFTGTSKQLARALDVFDSAPPSNTSSIRLHVFPYNYNKVSQLPGCFLSSPFPKLSRLDLAGFLPDPSSPIFTTSNLTSLKLFVFCRRGDGYTLSQLSQILQSHPNLREIGLDRGAIPLPVPSQAPPVPFVLPQLVDLRLYGPELPVLGFIDLIGMSSPLHNVVVRFGRTRDPLASAAKKVLVAYYGCPGLEQPRKVDRLTISHDPMNDHLTFNTQSDSAPTSNLELKFNEIDEDIRDTMVEEAFPLFPLNDIQEFAASGLDLHGDFYRGMFQGMKSLSHLRLCNLSISPVLDGLSSISQDETHQQILPKLESLTLSYLYILSGCQEKLFDFLKGRHDRGAGLKELSVRSCRVYKFGFKPKLMGLVQKIKWTGVTVLGSDCKDTGDDSETDWPMHISTSSI